MNSINSKPYSDFHVKILISAVMVTSITHKTKTQMPGRMIKIISNGCKAITPPMHHDAAKNGTTLLTHQYFGMPCLRPASIYSTKKTFKQPGG